MKRRPWKLALLLLVPLALYFYIAERNSWRPRTIALPQSPEPGRLQFSPDGRTLFCEDGGSDIYICDAKFRTARLSQVGSYRCFIENGRYLACSHYKQNQTYVVIRSMPDEKLVITGPKNFIPIGVLADGSTLIGRMDGKEQRNLFRWHWRSERSPQFHVRLSEEPDTSLYILEDKATITDKRQFWDLSTGKLRFQCETIGRVFGNSPNLLAFRSQDKKSVQIWNYQTGKLHKTMTLPAPTTNIALSPDGTMLATENSSGRILQVDVWDIKSGRLLRQLPFPSTRGYSITFSPDSGTLAVAATYTIYLWRIK